MLFIPFRMVELSQRASAQGVKRFVELGRPAQCELNIYGVFSARRKNLHVNHVVEEENGFGKFNEQEPSSILNFQQLNNEQRAT
ncbi:unnamed protein product [Ambrosiozyma monospora]|uniref:Unnamed protein product n=1 Tax=Ambrosiozyma monospora TaxID=43982 RepID=A0A9W7DD38_AMBMO|nr:unnamed protein product [Ambrosiozyma monospora]